jgi:hypothetical protein
MRATNDTKELLKQKIRDMTAGGGTNFLTAFERAFDVFEEAIPQELFVDCNTAVLFLTDGENRASDDGVVLEYVGRRIADIESQISHPIRIFTYSVSDVEDVHELPKSLACSTTSNGVWSKIVRPEDIVEGLSSYETLFALGLGEGNNRNFTAWVEPYEFFNAKIIGTTVSAPVFDRSVNPPLLVGVVGMDFPMSALDRALGVPLGSTATFDRVVRSSTAQCPNLNISSCQLESFRAVGPAGSEAQCSVPCNETASSLSLEAEQCPGDSAFSSTNGYSVSSVLANTEMDGVSFGARACCNVNTTELTEQCYSGGTPALSPFSSGSKQPAVWITLGIAAALVVNFGQLM